jgi:O-antigen/teichoic acid export membrane protein
MAAAFLSSQRVLARNAVINFGGSIAPLLAAVVAIPILVASLGTARFGFLTVAWVLIGYFGLFDLGLARALTKLVAEKLGLGAGDQIGPLAWTSLVLMGALSTAGAVVLAGLSPWLVGSALKIPTEMRGEALYSLYLMAFSLPWVIMTTGLRGILEASQRFGIVNALRVPMGLFSYLGPLTVLPFSTSLVAITGALVVGRLIAFVAHLVVCLRTMPQLSRVAFDWSYLGELGRFGGWITVSNIISPFMAYLDRFLIGGLVSMVAVAYYVTPYELVMKLTLLPTAVLGVLFPAFAATMTGDRQRTVALFDRACRAIFLGVFPCVLVVVTLAPEGFQLWLGSEFARESTRVLQWLALGVLINSVAQVPYSILQSGGRPDITGKLHIAEVPFYLLAIVWLARHYGIEGVAVAWVLRVMVDALFLFLAAERMVPSGGRILRPTLTNLAAGTALLFVGATIPSTSLKLLFLVVALGGFVLVAWRLLLQPVEREEILAAIPRLARGEKATGTSTATVAATAKAAAPRATPGRSAIPAERR